MSSQPMLSIEAALARILAHTPRAAVERLPLEAALGRVLAEPVQATVDLPLWDNSAMDGYAVRVADVPGTLRVLETIPAGGVPTATVTAGTASRIMTGAPVPDGAEAVVMIEDTHSVGDQVTVQRGAKLGQHIRRRGSDLQAGAAVLSVGRTLNPGALGICAGLGLSSVRVFQAPRVAVLSTGDEVIEPGRPLGPGQIWSSNNRALAGLIIEAGAVPVDLGNVRDDPTAIAAAFRDALTADVVLSTGGVSVGDFDHVKDVMAKLGVQMDFWRVAMKPGKPLAFGTIRGTPVFGLPGNPVSCMVNFLQFVRPMLRTMMGDPHPFLPVLQAELVGVIRRKPDRPEFIRVRLHLDQGRVFATPAGGHQGSGNMLSMSEAHGFVLAAADTAEVSGTVQVQVFDRSFLSTAAPDYPWIEHAHQPNADCC